MEQTFFIAVDHDETAIYGSGATPEEALADAIHQSGDGPDASAHGWKTHQASPALVAQVDAEGGAIIWGYVDDVAVTEEEREKAADESA